MIFNDKPHRRYNILTGEWVLVSPHRTKRPWQGKQEVLSHIQGLDYDKDCYLCPGNLRTSGERNPDYLSVHTFVNDFSALLEETEEMTFHEGLLKAESEKGICKVICFSPKHSFTLALMSLEDIQNVVSIWQEEYLKLGSIEWIKHVQIFENKGAVMGCSNPHPHGQIWAQSSIPQEVEKKGIKQNEYWKKNGRSLLQDYIQEEIKNNERVITQNKNFIALVPYWAVWPYEVIIIPKKHYQNIAQLSMIENKDFAEIIKFVTTKYDNLFETSFPYSSGIHQAPTDGLDHPEWHFHLSFYPPLLRSATVKKFMVGYEMFANPQRDITAEQAAKVLSSQSETHYTIEKNF